MKAKEFFEKVTDCLAVCFLIIGGYLVGFLSGIASVEAQDSVHGFYAGAAMLFSLLLALTIVAVVLERIYTKVRSHFKKSGALSNELQGKEKLKAAGCGTCNDTGYVRDGYDGEAPCEFCNHDKLVGWLREQWRQSEIELSVLKNSQNSKKEVSNESSIR